MVKQDKVEMTENQNGLKIIESPREGMQGFSRIIPTADKVRYIGQLLRVGFDTVEAGSVVSSRLIPTMADSLEVVEQLSAADQAEHSATNRKTNLMVLAVNARGADKIAGYEKVTHIAYPFSFVPTFLRLNVNSTVDDSFKTTRHVIEVCRANGKTAVIYLSMAFGNPYGDPWSMELLAEWIGRLYEAGARIIPLSNVSTEIGTELIGEVYSRLIPEFPGVEIGLHLHTANRGWFEKVDAAWMAGCRRFDGVIEGLGGCPMAGKDLLGNLNTANLLEFARRKGISTNIDQNELRRAYEIARELFS